MGREGNWKNLNCFNQGTVLYRATTFWQPLQIVAARVFLLYNKLQVPIAKDVTCVIFIRLCKCYDSFLSFVQLVSLTLTLLFYHAFNNRNSNNCNFYNNHLNSCMLIKEYKT